MPLGLNDAQKGLWSVYGGFQKTHGPLLWSPWNRDHNIHILLSILRTPIHGKIHIACWSYDRIWYLAPVVWLIEAMHPK